MNHSEEDRTADISRSATFTRRQAVALAGTALVTPALLSRLPGEDSPTLADPLYYSSAAALARAIRERKVSSEEVVSVFLKRTADVNPKLGAVVHTIGEDALAAARKADHALARGGRIGALHGVPMTIKDSFETAGVITTAGTLGRATFVPTTDATVVARLRAAGAILTGKTNTPELTAKNHTDNLVFGRTNNPYDLDRSPGGSSGGAAAIVAAGGSAFDIGSDAGGSIRYPSHCCGIVGIKPTFGRVPRTGHVPGLGGLTDRLMHVGPLARSVDDLTLLLRIISGPDYRDPAAMPSTVQDPLRIEMRPLRIAFFCDNGILAPTRDVQTTVRTVADHLARVASVEEKRPAGVDRTSTIIYALWAADGGAYFRDALRAAGTTKHTLDWIEDAKPVAMADYLKVVADWSQFQTEMLRFMEAYDVIICPANAEPAIRHAGFADFHPRFSYAHTFNLTGWPAVVVRAGTSADGLPIGVQIVARPWRDEVALAVARHVESKLGGFRPSTTL